MSLFHPLNPGPPNLAQRQKIAKDTIARSQSIIQEHATSGATADSTFIADQLPELDSSACPKFPASQVKIINADSFTTAREIMQHEPGAKVAVLNLASDEQPGGGWEYSLAKTQVKYPFPEFPVPVHSSPEKRPNS